MLGNSLVVQRWGFCAFTVEGPGLIPGQGTKISQAAQCGYIYIYIYILLYLYTDYEVTK